MMEARLAQDGQVYNLPAVGQRPAFTRAECNGWNYTKEFLLFVVFDKWGKRRVVTVAPNADIQAA